MPTLKASNMRLFPIDVAWDDRRHTWRAPDLDNSFETAQRYFKIALVVLGIGSALLVGLFALLIAFSTAV